MKNKTNIILKLFLLFLFAVNLSFFFAHPVQAQFQTTYSGVQDSISQYLCTPDNDTLYGCVNKFYRVAIAFGSVVAVLFIVIGGYIYMSDGGEGEGKKKGKDILISTITALVILYMGYVFLRYLNPDIVQFNTIQPPDIKDQVQTLTATTGSCSNCQDYTINGLSGNASQKPGVNTFLNQDLITKLKKAKSLGGNFIVSEAYPPTVTHSDACHNNGTCADINVLNKTAAEIDNLCKALTGAGLSNTNEYYTFTQAQTPDCPPALRYETTTGENMHVK